MKKILTSLLAVAVAAMAFSGCSKDEDEMRGEEPMLSVKLIAESEVANQTRTEFDAETNNIIWSNGDKVSFYVNGVFKGQQGATTTDGGKTASFVVSGLTANQTNNIQGVYSAASDYHSDVKVNSEVVAFGMKIPDTQAAVAGSYDKDADALVMDMLTLTPTATSEEISAQKVRFARPVAISKVTFKGVTPEAGETVSAARFEVAAPGKFLTGNYRFNPTTRTFVGADGKTAVADKNNIFHMNGKQSVVVNCENVPFTGTFDVMFVTAPVTLNAGDEIVFTFMTNKRKFTKRITLNKEVAFLNTKLNKLAVNLSGVTPEKGESSFVVKATDSNLTHAENPLKVENRYLYSPDKSVAVILGDGSAFYYNGANSQYNVFAKSTLIVEGKEIDRIVWTGDLKKDRDATDPAKVTANCGTYNDNGKEGTWAANANDHIHRVVFTTNENVYQWRISTVTVYYKDDTTAEFTPEIMVKGYFNDFEASAAKEQTVNFSVVNNPQNLAVTLNNADLKHFHAEIRGGNVLAVKPLADNTTSAHYTETLIMKVGAATQEFVLEQLASNEAAATEVKITAKQISDGGLGTGKVTVEGVTATVGDLKFTFKHTSSQANTTSYFDGKKIRFYGDETLTITSVDGTKVIEHILIRESGNKGGKVVDIDDPAAQPSLEWTGSKTVLNLKAVKQLRIDDITVTYK